MLVLKEKISDVRAFIKYSKLVNNSNRNGEILKKMQDLNSIFIHIPKTGGKSILTSFYGVGVHDGFGHAPMEFYQSVFSKNYCRSAFKFAFVRNPWDRLYSAYKFALKGGFGFETDIWLKEQIDTQCKADFRIFVKEWLPKQNIDEIIILKPQYKFVSDQSGQLLLDHACYFERFSEECDFVSKQLNITNRVSHLNSAAHPSGLGYLDAFDSEMIDITYNLYRKDADVFGYEFQGIMSEK